MIDRNELLLFCREKVSNFSSIRFQVEWKFGCYCDACVVDTSISCTDIFKVMQNIIGH